MRYTKRKRRNKSRPARSQEQREEVQRRYRRGKDRSGEQKMEKLADASNLQAMAGEADRKDTESYRLQAKYQALKDAEPSSLPDGQYSCKFDAATAGALGSGKTLTNGLRPVGPSQAMKILQTGINEKYDAWRTERKFKELCKDAGVSRPRGSKLGSEQQKDSEPTKKLSAQELREQRSLLIAKIRDFIQRQKDRSPFRDRSRFDETMQMRGR